MRPFMLVVDDSPNDKGVSSVLTSLLGKGIQLLTGINAFKAAWKSTPTVGDAVGAANNTSRDVIAAKLRLKGIDPDAYFAALGDLLPNNIDDMTADEINDAISKAQSDAKDPSQQWMLWMVIAGIAAFAFTGMNKRRAFRSFAGRIRTRFSRGPRFRSRRFRGRRRRR